MEAIATVFGQTLNRVGKALHDSFTGAAVEPRWGVAGLREEALVFLLAESMRAIGWTCEYEQSYGDGGRHRGDLLATKPGEQALWLEAKWWWWWHVELSDVLAADRWKLERMRGQHRPVAAVFTVDAKSTKPNRSWTIVSAHDWFRASAPAGWQFVGCCAVNSPYRGTSTADPQKTDRQGVFAAAFFELAG